jgi:hypothetical protein
MVAVLVKIRVALSSSSPLSLTATDHHWPAIVEAISPEGHIGVIDDPEHLDIVPLKRKSVSVHWEYMFTRPLLGTEDMIGYHYLRTKRPNSLMQACCAPR